MQQFITAPHRGGSGAPVSQTGSPNAALLIDFDNVTMGIRSDLTRQLKELLNSDIIKGKVAVQRAYADWRRYAQYIVPLSEASVDLIFAPAYGSSKKNATDIRLAIDALELVFTRPEIGTFILLSGDSDFSSLVLKLKEYGKYVIGVGLRESASDLLVQNCDEYYSYSSLTGLTRAGEEDSVSATDAWELAERAVNQMASDDDVMRSDRLKQVMLELDPNFDEGQLGFSKFNKFLAEAASRNRLALKKLENGQYEVQPYEREAERRDERPRGRGRRDRKEEPRERERSAASVPEPRAPAEATPGAQDGQPAARSVPEGRGGDARKPEPRAQQSARRPSARPVSRERRAEGLDDSYALLRRAVQELTDGPGGAARDSDIKRKMLELESGWDEASLGFTKFSRFLRQAHDAEVIDLARNPDGFYEARLGRAGGRAESEPRRDRERDRARREPAAEREPAGRRRDREERPAKPAARPETEPAPTEATHAPDEAAVEERAVKDEPVAGQRETPDEPAVEEPAAREDQSGREEVAASAAEAAAGPGAGERAAGASAGARPAGFGRRGRRRGAAEGPPPLLPGQVVGEGEGGPAARESSARDEPATAAAAAPEAGAPPAGQGDEQAPAEQAPAEQAATSPGGAAAPSAEAVERGTPEPGEPAAHEAPVGGAVDPAALGLPTDRGAVIRYLSNSYQGVGQKTAEALIEAFGADQVFNGLNDQPDRVREILGMGRRTDALLNAWQRDLRRRSTAGSGDGVSEA